MAFEFRGALALASPPVPRAIPRWSAVLGRSVARWAVVLVDALALAAAAGLAGLSGWLGAAYVAVALAALAAGHRTRISPNLGDELPAMVGKVCLPVLLLGAAAADDGTTRELVWTAPLAVGLVMAGRALSYHLIRLVRRSGLLVEPTVIVGAGRQGVLVAETLVAHPEYGLLPVGFLDSFDDELTPPILGDVDALDRVLGDFSVQRVIVAFGAAREREMMRALRVAHERGVDVHVMPRFFELGVVPLTTDADDVWGIRLVRVRPARPAAWWGRRALDVALAGAALVMVAPVLAAVAVALRLTGRGPVLVRERASGPRGTAYASLRFRTSSRSGAVARPVTGDDTGRLGRFLLRTGLDRLPRLISVLTGEAWLYGGPPPAPAPGAPRLLLPRRARPVVRVGGGRPAVRAVPGDGVRVTGGRS